MKGNKGQICWLWRKVQVPSSSSTSTPAAAAVAPPPSSSPPLPATALSNGNVHSSASAECGGALFRPLAPLSGHDALFGPGFGADRLGGPGPAEALAAALQVARGERVVDWGCGLGGVGLAAAEAYGARAWGVEGRVTLVERAVEVRGCVVASVLVGLCVVNLKALCLDGPCCWIMAVTPCHLTDPPIVVVLVAKLNPTPHQPQTECDAPPQGAHRAGVVRPGEAGIRAADGRRRGHRQARRCGRWMNRWMCVCPVFCACVVSWRVVNRVWFEQQAVVLVLVVVHASCAYVRTVADLTNQPTPFLLARYHTHQAGTTLPSLPRVAKWLKPGGRVVAGVLGSGALI